MYALQVDVHSSQERSSEKRGPGRERPGQGWSHQHGLPEGRREWRSGREENQQHVDEQTRRSHQCHQ